MMGYSISQEKYEKLERNRREGRLCSMNNGRGGCSARATVRQHTLNWYYEEEKLRGDPPREGTSVLCRRHANEMPPGYEGRNFTVVSEERF